MDTQAAVMSGFNAQEYGRRVRAVTAADWRRPPTPAQTAHVLGHMRDPTVFVALCGAHVRKLGRLQNLDGYKLCPWCVVGVTMSC